MCFSVVVARALEGHASAANVRVDRRSILSLLLDGRPSNAH